jgi:tellurite resistance protein
LDKQGEYVECLNCKDTFKPNILDYDPVKNSVAIEAEYHSAIKKVMIHVLLSDGVIDEDEVVTAQDIYQRIAGQKIEKSQLHKEIEQIEASNESLSSTLINLQGSLNDEGKEMVVKAALYVAMADGEFQKEEQAMLVQIGKDLGMTQAHLKGVLSSADS